MAKSTSGGGSLWSGIAQAGGAIGGALIGGASGKKAQKRQHEYNKEIMDIQAKYLDEQNRKNNEAQLKFWKDTNYPEQVKQMRDAGLNVGLMYEGAGGAGATTGSQGAMEDDIGTSLCQ